MTRLDAIENAIRAISRRVLGADHSIAELATLDAKHDEQAPAVSAPALPSDVEERLIALEDFARTASELVNRCNADILAAREEIAALNARLNAILSKPDQHGLAPMAHYHDTKGVQAA